jgi:hypothetical protein
MRDERTILARNGWDNSEQITDNRNQEGFNTEVTEERTRRAQRKRQMGKSHSGEWRSREPI